MRLYEKEQTMNCIYNKINYFNSGIRICVYLFFKFPQEVE